MLHHLKGAIVVAGVRIDLGGLSKFPARVVIFVFGGGELQFTNREIDQPAIAQKLCLLQVKIVGRRFFNRDLLCMIERRNAVE